MRTCAVDLGSGETRLARADAIGPVDLALQHPDALVIGAGPLASADMPGSHRLVFCGRSPLWDGFSIRSGSQGSIGCEPHSLQSPRVSR